MNGRCARCRREPVSLCRRGICQLCAWADYLALRSWITEDDRAAFMAGWDSAVAAASGRNV